MIEEHDLESELINSELGELHEGWAIKDDSAADWAIEKIAKLETEYRRKEMVAQNKIAQIQQWLDKERAWKEQQRSFFEEKIREYFDTLPVEVR